MRPPPTLLGLAVALLAAACSSAAAPRAEIPALATSAVPITGAPGDYDPLLAAAADATLVLLGEATHGTHEFYRERDRITRRLVAERGFGALALEADWADAARVDRYVRGDPADATAEAALGGFTRFPRWMWRNREFAALVQWLREHNDSLPAGEPKVGVYGLDLYGLDDSLTAVVDHLRRLDPPLAEAAAARYRCFERHRADPQAYGLAAARSARASCRDEAAEQLAAIRAWRPPDGRLTPARRADLFAAEQNARVVQGAEEYYRESARGEVSGWNLRDRHMVATMAAVQEHLLATQGGGRLVVWAHNSHVGDARATGRKRFGEWNIGQLVREHWDRGASFAVGFTTHTGTVMAADGWDSPGRVKELNPSLPGSHGAVLHEVGLPAFLLLLGGLEADAVRKPRQQRAVGVIYRPDAERDLHYFPATLREQFDAVVHVDLTTAVQPLD